MPAEIDTLALLDHIDKKFADADWKRSDGLGIVHRKIDEHAREAREALDKFRTETSSTLGSISASVGDHENRIGAIEKGAKAKAIARDGWWKTGATIVLGSGGLWTFLEWLRGGWRH